MKTLSGQAGTLRQAQTLAHGPLWPSLAVRVALGVGDMEKRGKYRTGQTNRVSTVSTPNTPPPRLLPKSPPR